MKLYAASTCMLTYSAAVEEYTTWLNLPSSSKIVKVAIGVCTLRAEMLYCIRRIVNKLRWKISVSSGRVSSVMEMLEQYVLFVADRATCL